MKSNFRHVTSRLALSFFCILSVAPSWAIEGESVAPVFNSLGGPVASADCNLGYTLLIAGKEQQAYDAFQQALKANPKEASALFGLGQQEALRGNIGKAFDLCSRAFSEGRNDPWAEIYLDVAKNMLPYCKDPEPFLNVLREVEADPKGKAFLKDRVRLARAEWLTLSGKFEAAQKAFAPLQFLSKWSLIGPFDNRDKAGLMTVFEPENEINFSRAVQGRNRKVSWFFPKVAPLNGVVDFSEVFTPNTHSLGYAVTHFQVPESQWAVMRLGCGGAARLWVNDREVLKVDTYNAYSVEKAAVPVYLQKGLNRVMVKSAVEEALEWSFSIRVSRPEGGPVVGLVLNNNEAVLKAYKESAEGRSTPLLEPEDPDLGVLVLLKNALKRNPDDALLHAYLGFEYELRSLGNVEDRLAAKELEKAIARSPRCPLFRMMYAHRTDDVNESRVAAEYCMKTFPDLVAPYEYLSAHAFESGMMLASEKVARLAQKKFGFERTPVSGLQLSFILQERGQRAEAFRLARRLTKQAPYHSGHWLQRLDLEVSASARRATLLQALTFCGGDNYLRSRRANQLAAMEQDEAGALFLAKGEQHRPYNTGTKIILARAWRRSGNAEKAALVLEAARASAPENPELLAALGTESLYAGKKDAAIALWRQVLKIKPNSPEIKDQLSELAEGKGLDSEFFAAYDIKLKDLSFPEADAFPDDNAVTVFKQEVVQVNPNGTSSKMVHQVSKLLRPSGKRALQSHAIYFDPHRQVVDVLRAAVITPDGQELSRAQVYDRTVSAAMGVETKIYDEHHLKQIVFRDLEVGSVVDLQYVIRDTGMNIYGDYFAEVVYMGDSRPVQKSQFILSLPKNRTFKTEAFRARIVPERLQSKNPEREIFKWETLKQPGIQQQKWMPPARDLIPFVQVTTMKTWQEVGQWYWNLSKEQLQTSDGMKETVAQLTKGLETDTEKLRVIHDWVIRKVRYLGIEFGRNGYKPHRAIDTFNSRYGDCKDTAALITAMLKEVKIDSKLVLVRTVNAGRVEAESLPAPNLFNHCIAYVPDADGKDYWLDCTTDYHQLGEVPYMDQGAQVLVIGPEGGSFVQIPKGTAKENLREQRVDATLKKDGSGTVFIRDVRRGQEAPYSRQAAATPGQFKRMIEAVGAKRFPGAKLLRLNNSKPEDPGPMWVESEFSVPKLAAQSGERFELSGCFTPLNLSTLYLSAGERKHDLELYYPRAKDFEIHYHLNEAFVVVALPENVSLTEDFGTFERTVTQDGHIIRIKDSFELSSQRIPKAAYKKFKAFCDKIDSVLEKKLLIKRK